MKKTVRNTIARLALKRYHNKGWVKSIMKEGAPRPKDFDENAPSFDDWIDGIIQYLEGLRKQWGDYG